MPARRALAALPDFEYKQIETRLLDEPSLPSREHMDEAEFADLVDSIRSIGVVEPLIVFPVGNRYEVTAGHRRLLASRAVGRKLTPCLIANDRNYDHTAAQLAENIHREALNPAAEAMWFKQLMDKKHWDFEELCVELKQKQDYVGHRLRLLAGDPQIFDDLREGRISLGTARALNTVDDDLQRNYFRHQAVQQNSSVRTVEHWVRDWKQSQSLLPPQAPAVPIEIGAPAMLEDPMTCYFCRGNNDKYNMESIWVHKYELKWIKEQLEAARKAE